MGVDVRIGEMFFTTEVQSLLRPARSRRPRPVGSAGEAAGEAHTAEAAAANIKVIFWKSILLMWWRAVGQRIVRSR